MMRTYAHIVDDQVYETLDTDGDITTMFNPELVWIDITGLVPKPDVGWAYDGVEFSPPAPPPGPTLDELKEVKRDEINASYTLATSVLAAGYPDSERESWPVQVMESAALLSDPQAVTPWIDAASAARGITREQMATKIRDMDFQYRSISGALTGQRQALRDAIDTATTPEQLSSISWPPTP